MTSRIRRSVEYLTRPVSQVVVVLIAIVFLFSSATSISAHEKSRQRSPATIRPNSAMEAAIPAPLFDKKIGLRDGPTGVPLELIIPTVNIHTSVLGVGSTAKNAMDAPVGKFDDPVWQQAFWYRGSAIPGQESTALFAGHVSDPLGRGGVFATLTSVVVGDPIIVRDTRNGIEIHFQVSGLETKPLADFGDEDLLKKIYGTGPVAGVTPQSSDDGLSHLTLVTCAGVFQRTTHDHRLIVYATRAD